MPMWVEVQQEVWSMLGGTDQNNASFLSVGQGMRDVLGWTSDDLLGRSVLDIVADECVRNTIAGFILAMRTYQRRHYLRSQPAGGLDSARWKKVRCRLRKKDGELAEVWFVLYRADPDSNEEGMLVDASMELGLAISPAHLVCQIRLVGSKTELGGSDSRTSGGSNPLLKLKNAASSLLQDNALSLQPFSCSGLQQSSASAAGGICRLHWQ